METLAIGISEVDIIVDSKKYCSAENTINDLNKAMGFHYFYKYGSSVIDISNKTKRVRTKFNFNIDNKFFLSNLFKLKERMPAYIIDIYFY
jgi:hypothetical protein